MNSGKRMFGQAVVVGGSVAGLLAARGLSEHFEKVIVLERDAAPEGAEPHKGVPQGRHVHVLLEAGLTTMEAFFPGFTEELRSAGGKLIDLGVDTAWYHFGAWKPHYRSGIETVLCTRPLIEALLRRRVSALPNVELRHGVSVEGPVADEAKARITGVKVKGPSGEEILPAELVVDASGRGTRAPRWLEELGYGRPPEEQVGIDLAYTTRVYEAPAQRPGPWKFLAVYSRPPKGWRSGFVCEVEDGRWVVSLNGYFGDHPPLDEQAFLEFARSLPSPEVYDAIKDAKALTAPTMHKIPSSRWWHYEKLARFPDGLVAVGDAACALNPVYGQGMTVSALGAKRLTDCVAKAAEAGTLKGLSQPFQTQLAELIFVPWLLASTMDLRYPQTEGKRMWGLGALTWALSTMNDMTSQNVEACHRFFEALNMRRGLEAMLTPRILGAFLVYGVKSLFLPLEKRANVKPLPSQPSKAPRPDAKAAA